MKHMLSVKSTYIRADRGGPSQHSKFTSEILAPLCLLRKGCPKEAKVPAGSDPLFLLTSCTVDYASLHLLEYE